MHPPQRNPRSLPIDPEVWACYLSASRRLRRKVGTKAPAPLELIHFELAGRNPQHIASCYLDHPRDIERRRKIEPGRRPNMPVLRPLVWPGRRPAAPAGDPTRN